MNPLSSLAFIVTDDCNFQCRYCPQSKAPHYMSPQTIAKSIDFFFPYLKKDALIIFYGGEPLLAFPLIQYAVSLFNQKNSQLPPDLAYTLHFSVTTNGSLLTPAMLDFFQVHHFNLILSFDGNTQDYARHDHTALQLSGLIPQILKRTHISLTVNCVIPPDTVDQLYPSLRAIIEFQVPSVMMSPSYIHPWDATTLHTLSIQLEQLSSLLLEHYQIKNVVPLTNFQPPNNPQEKHGCSAALDRLAVSPVPDVWGCFLFHPLLKDKTTQSDFNTYCFGTLDFFIENHHTHYPEILLNYQQLKQACFFTPQQNCFLCSQVSECAACPADLAHATQSIGLLPTWYCDLALTLRTARKKFLQRLSALTS